jgi:ribosome biogenesis protein Nip4
VKALTDFIAQFKTNFTLNSKHVVKKYNRYYLLEDILQQIPQNFFYAGTYLGAVKGSSFFPSFLLLDMISKNNANKIIVDYKTAWLFVCGRDIFKQGILQGDDLPKGAHVLVMGELKECLGFGKIVGSIQNFDINSIFVKNVLDIGDFLRRERKQMQKNPKRYK